MGRARLVLAAEERAIMRAIMAAVSGAMMVPERLIADNRRAHALTTLARLMFTRMARRRGYSFGKIAMFVGWNHTSVMYQWRIGEAAVEENEARGHRIAELERRIEARMASREKPRPFVAIKVPSNSPNTQKREVYEDEDRARVRTDAGYITRAGEIICRA